jgi:hypothetical protein
MGQLKILFIINWALHRFSHTPLGWGPRESLRMPPVHVRALVRCYITKQARVHKPQLDKHVKNGTDAEFSPRFAPAKSSPLWRREHSTTRNSTSCSPVHSLCFSAALHPHSHGCCVRQRLGATGTSRSQRPPGLPGARKSETNLLVRYRIVDWKRS